MKILKKIIENRILSFVILTAISAGVIVSLSSIVGTANGSEDITSYKNDTIITDNTAKAVLAVNGLSCSSCIQDIKDGLVNVDGIENILVDISNATAQIYYDSTKISNPESISERISELGYPAEIKYILTSEELTREEELINNKKEFYIASINDWEISRADYETEIKAAVKQINNKYGEETINYENNNPLLDNIKIQTVNKLIDEAVMLQDISKSGFKLNEEEFETQYNKYIVENFSDNNNFESILAENGYSPDYFENKFKNNVLISEYLENKVFLTAGTDIQKQNEFYQWYSTIRSLADITYYDKELESLAVNSQSGSSCCTTQ